jgi:hypothetical protein
MMINNSTNVNKINNQLSPQIIEHKKTMSYDNGNSVSKNDRHRNVRG